MIDVRNLHKAFGDHEVLKGVNEHIEKGEKVVIIGPSGSGKSTFLRCLNLLEEPTSGDIVFEGQNITSKETDINLVRRKMGMVFQQFNLFPHLTVRENIKLAPVKLKVMTDEEADKRAMQLLERVGLPDKADSYPIQLSGGQQQRIAIARALAMNPDVMLFDEPTSALDPEMVGEVLEIMKEPGGRRDDDGRRDPRDGLCARGRHPRAVHGRRQHRRAERAERIFRQPEASEVKGFSIQGAVNPIPPS